MNDDVLRGRLSDHIALALTLFGEAAGEPVESRIAVGNVIRNRLGEPRRYGQSYRDVCHKRSQFSCWWAWGGADNYHRLMALAAAVVEGHQLPITGYALDVYQECLFLSEGIIGGQLRDNTKGATHYYNPAAMVPRGRVPDWAQRLLPCARAGAHLFFRGVD